MLIGLHIFVILSVWSSVIATNEGGDLLSPSILNGNVVRNRKKYPWHAYLNYDIDGTTFICGGSLISKKYILTAGHCTNACSTTTTYEIRLGTVNLDKRKGKTTFTGKLKGCHTLYNDNTLEYDVAVIELDKPLKKYSRTIRRVRLMPEEPQDLSNFAVIATGFGLDENGNLPDKLMVAKKIKVLSTASCQTKLDAQNLGTFRDHTICTDSNSGQQTCGGDSGGPLVHKRKRKYWHVGLTSYGSADCSKPPSVYTKTNHPQILSWITMTTGVNPAKYP